MTSVVAPIGDYGFSYQRKSFYSKGRFWKFYSDDTDMVYRTSTDGETWSAPTIARLVCGSGQHFSIWFDGIYLHYVYCKRTTLFYRRGTPNINGTLPWSAVEQAVSTTHDKAHAPMISVSSDGYAWIGYSDYLVVRHPYVIRSGNKVDDTGDGTWGVTPGVFPYQLSAVDASWYVSVIPLTAGKMLALYSRGGQGIRAIQWDGAAWSTVVATNKYPIWGVDHSAVAEGDSVHLVFQTRRGTSELSSIIYTKWTYNSFSAEIVLLADTATILQSNPVLCRSGSDLYVFWAGYPMTGHVYYMKYEDGVWKDGVDWISDLQVYGMSLSCFYLQRYGYVGLSYVTGTTIKFNYFTTDPYEPDPGPPPEPGVPTPPPVLEPEPTKMLDVSINASGSRHVYKPSQGHRQRSKRGRTIRHITWVPVSIVRA